MTELTIRPEDIRDAIEANVASFSPDTTREELGRVLIAGDGIARVEGLPSVMTNELLEFEDGTLGVALNLDIGEIGVVVLGEFSHIEEGQAVKRTREVLSVPVGNGYLGRVVDGREPDTKSLREDAAVAQRFNFPAEYVEAVPYFAAAGAKFSYQAKFHPLKYLNELLRTIPGSGSHVFEKTEATEFVEKPLTVKAGSHSIRCRYLVLATHTPLVGKARLISATLLMTKLYLYTSYALGAKLPHGVLPEALFWDTDSPCHYLRVDRRRGFDYAIFGGEDHKTGQEERTEDVYARLERKLRKWIPKAVVKNRGSGQVIETNDGLPFIGETAEKQFVATDFSGNGMTFGTLGAMMAVDACLERKNP